jgi:hypothetical protein
VLAAYAAAQQQMVAERRSTGMCWLPPSYRESTTVMVFKCCTYVEVVGFCFDLLLSTMLVLLKTLGRVMLCTDCVSDHLLIPNYITKQKLLRKLLVPLNCQ